MKKIFLTVTLIICVFLLSHCSALKLGTSTKADIKAFQGKPISIALAKWGPATNTSDDGKGGLIYTWERIGATTTSYDKNMHTSSTTTTYCTRNLFVDNNGIIYHGIYEGNDCN